MTGEPGLLQIVSLLVDLDVVEVDILGGESQVHGTGGAVALFGDDDLGLVLFFRLVIDPRAVQEEDEIRILLYRARVPKVFQTGPVRMAPPFGPAVELRQDDYRDSRLTRKRLNRVLKIPV